MLSVAYNHGDSSPSTTVKERRLVYNNESGSEGRAKNESVNRPRKSSKRSSSTFNTMAVLFAAAVAIILYISNIIAVNRLAVEVSDLQQKFDSVSNGNEILRAEINRRSSLERIGKIATDQLGLRYPKEQPTWLVIDEKLATENRTSK
jgi:cell division protein FtsL